MNIFVDFEATQPAGEIIAIGAKAENGEQFFDDIMKKFNKWCNSLCIGRIYQHFYSYGAADKQFLINSFQSLNSDDAINLVSYMITTMQDYSENVALFFNGSTSLIKAYNYFENEKEQKHNALEDAEMLAEVFVKITDKEPLSENPFVERAIYNYTFPSGRFFCKGKGKNAKEREFGCIQEAIEWLINTNIAKDSRDAVHRDKMATKIMKAIRKNECYMNYKWRREK